MRHLPKVLLAGVFALVVFVPRESLGSLVYWSLFPIMFLLLALHYRVSYWVSAGWVERTIRQEVRMSLFCAKAPPLTSEDFIRGRLVLCSGTFTLYSKPVVHASLLPVPVWSVNTEDLAGFGFCRGLGIRSTLVLRIADGGEARFSAWIRPRSQEAIRCMLSAFLPELEVK